MKIEQVKLETLTPSGLRVYQSLIPVEYRRYVRDKRTISLGYREHGIAVAVAIARLETDRVELVWVQVHGLFRRGGLGRFLVEQLAERAKAAGAQQMELDYGLDQPQMDVATAFFTACGFQAGKLVGYFITCPFSAVMGGQAANQTVASRHSQRIYPLLDLPESVAEQYEAMEATLQTYCRLAGVKGKCLPRYTLAYTDKGGVGATLMLSAIGEDLYFNSFYATSGNLNGVIQMIFTAFSDLRQRNAQYNKLCLAVITPMAQKLAHRLMSDLPFTELPSYHRVWKF